MIEAWGRHYDAIIHFTEDNWWVLKIHYVLFDGHYEACGRGRKFETAEKFAKQALRKALIKAYGY